MSWYTPATNKVVGTLGSLIFTISLVFLFVSLFTNALLCSDCPYDDCVLYRYPTLTNGEQGDCQSPASKDHPSSSDWVCYGNDFIGGNYFFYCGTVTTRVIAVFVGCSIGATLGFIAMLVAIIYAMKYRQRVCQHHHYKVIQ